MDWVQIWDGSLDEDELEKEGYDIVTWPDSQIIFDKEDFFDHCWLINDEEGYNTYGSCAYVVDKDWFNK